MKEQQKEKLTESSDSQKIQNELVEITQSLPTITVNVNVLNPLANKA